MKKWQLKWLWLVMSLLTMVGCSSTPTPTVSLPLILGKPNVLFFYADL